MNSSSQRNDASLLQSSGTQISAGGNTVDLPPALMAILASQVTESFDTHAVNYNSNPYAYAGMPEVEAGRVNNPQATGDSEAITSGNFTNASQQMRSKVLSFEIGSGYNSLSVSGMDENSP